MPKTTIVNEAVREKVDVDTGEIVELEHSVGTRTIYSQEPPFIKLYIADLLYMYDMPKTLTNVLYTLLDYTTFAGKQNGMCIILNSYIKKQILEKCGWDNMRSLNNALTKLAKGNILKRLGDNTYQLNPYFFGRGEWRDIDNIRATWDYNAIKGRTFQAAITYKTNKADTPIPGQMMLDEDDNDEECADTARPAV